MKKQGKLVASNDKAGILPASALFRPTSPFERRMIEFSLRHQVPPLGSLEAARLQRTMDMDVGFQLKLKAMEKRLPHFLSSRMSNGSGMQQSKLLRSYFHEYFNRLFTLGPASFPTSFNVVESFMAFDRRNRFFDLRHEREHLLSINEYFRWYEKGEIPHDPRILESLMSEGVIYSYDMLIDESSWRISGDTQQLIAGVSFIRHKQELSCLLLAGENPPFISDEEILKALQSDRPANPKGVVAHPDLSTKDRYLDGYPQFGRVIVLTRIDLSAGKHDVRYVNLDTGPSFTVFTDDFSVFGDLPPEEVGKLRDQVMEGLARYDSLFSALSSMIYLPAFFAAFPQNVQDIKVVTELFAMRDDKTVRDTIAALGGLKCDKHRKIRCFPTAHGVNEGQAKKIDPPEIEFKSDGYWRAISPQAIGEDKNGDKIFGRTWVSRHESWSARSPQAFMLAKMNFEPQGPDPGTIYVQRSAALEHNLYKIGLSRRSAEVRAGELSSATGVPLPFDVLATWAVGDCAVIEKKIHEKLSPFRINPRREFFRSELKHIIAIIQAVILDIGVARDDLKDSPDLGSSAPERA